MPRPQGLASTSERCYVPDRRSLLSVVSPCRAKVMLSGLIVFFCHCVCIYGKVFMCVNANRVYSRPHVFMLQSQLLPSYPPLRRRIVQQPGRRLFSTLLSPAPVAKATNQKLSALWSTTRAPPALPTRKNTQGAAISCDAAFGKCPQCSSEMGTERERERLDTMTRAPC